MHINTPFSQHCLEFPVTDAVAAIPTHSPHDDCTFAVPLFEKSGFIALPGQLAQQPRYLHRIGSIPTSAGPPPLNFCNSANRPDISLQPGLVKHHSHINLARRAAFIYEPSNVIRKMNQYIDIHSRDAHCERLSTIRIYGLVRCLPKKPRLFLITDFHRANCWI